MAELSIKGLRKEYGKKVAVDDFSLHIQDGELVVIVGPSGCGKSTTLRMIAGLETVTSGSIVLEGREINDIDTKDRDIAMVFQNYALYSNMTAFENIAFPLKIRKESKDEIYKKVMQIAGILKIESLLGRKPNTLSGGEKQRVAMGRALVRKPKLFLMDEPLSNLDARLKVQLREEIRSIQRRLGTTTIYVTHDQTEAMSIADRVVVMNQGKIMQADVPEKIYNEPADPFVAGFFGTYGMNIWEEEDRIFGVRPEDIFIVNEDTPSSLKAEIKEQYYSGNSWIIKAQTEKGTFNILSKKNICESENVRIKWHDKSLHCWEKDSRSI